MIGYGLIDINGLLKFKNDGHAEWTNDLWTDYFYHHQSDIPLYKKEVMDPLRVPLHFEKLQKIIQWLNEINQKLCVFQMDDIAAVIGYNTMRFVVPSEFVNLEELKNYNEITVDEIKSIGVNNSPGNLPAYFDNYSVNSISEKKAEAEMALNDLSQEAKDIESGNVEELAILKKQMDELQAQMEEKKKALMETLNQKKNEIEEKVKAFKKQLFILETQIYGIRCYLGEVVNFFTLRDGKPADINAPIVIYQKLRYLDVELGRYLSLYDFGDHKDDLQTFLDILRTRDDIVDLLAPGEKSINVVKISRTGTVKGDSEHFQNMLDDYKMLHENQLAILIRNGEQLHITWLDSDKINLEDDNVFLKPKTEVSVASSEESDEWNDWFNRGRREQEQRRQQNEFLSRWFFFSVLQGVLDNTSLISIPDHVNIMNSSYIVFSDADGWIETNRYGTFADILKKSEDIPLMKGDHILTGMCITKEHGIYGSRGGAWDNTRGIGQKNRTDGITLPGRKILQVNKVIPGLVVKYTAEIRKGEITVNPKGKAWYRNKDGSLSTYRFADEEFDHYETNYDSKMLKEIVKTETWEETIEGIRWYEYDHSYRNLSTYQLIKFSNGYGECKPFIYRDDAIDKDHKFFRFSYADAYNNGTDVYYFNIVNAEIIGFDEHQYFCSVEREGWRSEYGDYRKTKYWVNFEFNLNEVIPLSFLCSSWIKEVIRSGKIGNFALCGAHMGFTDMLPYLNKILDFVKKREEDERQLLIEAGGDDYLNNTPDWDIALTEWRIKHKYHSLTKNRAKSFLKNIQK